MQTNDKTTVEFSGTYKQDAAQLYKDALNYFDASPTEAKRLAMAFMSDFGEAIKNSEARGKASKANSDGLMNLSDARKVGKVHATPALSIWRITLQLNALRGEGVVYAGLKVQLVERLGSWLANVPAPKQTEQVPA